MARNAETKDIDAVYEAVVDPLPFLLLSNTELQDVVANGLADQGEQ